MAICDRATKCEFFHNRMATMPATPELIKKSFCYENYTNCARRILMLFVSEKLFLIDEDLAEKITELIPELVPNDQEKVRELLF